MAKRLGKTSQKQYELLNFVKSNKILISGKTKPSDYKMINNLWVKFSVYINALGYGPQKTWQQWRQALVEWKQNTRKKSRKIQQELMSTGGGPHSGVKLSELEEELLSLLGKIHLGDPDVIDYFHARAQTCALATVTNVVGEIIDPPETICPIQENIYVLDNPKLEHTNESDSQSGILNSTEARTIMKQPKTCIKKSGTTKTRNILQEAAKCFENAQLMAVETTKSNVEAINSVANAIKEHTAVNKATLKLEYYKVFGTFENFEDLFN